MVPSFKDRLQAVNPKYETFERLHILQVNLGNLCNLHCTHCHVDASSRGTEIMGPVIMGQIAGFLARRPGYLRMLAGRFNPEAAGSIMCRTLLSVDWQGKICNCNFNQALGMPIRADDGSEITISELDDADMRGKQIDRAQHCYCCTAGEGSSCTGALIP